MSILDVDKNECVFDGFPVRYEFEDYQAAQRVIIETYSKIPGVISIYFVGSIAHRGISDIDVLVITKDKAKANFMKWHLNKKHAYLSYHPPHILSKSLAKRILWVYPGYSLRHSFGEHICFEKPRDMRAIDIALLNDYLIRSYPRDFLIPWVSRKFNVRQLLLRLNSINMSFSAFSSLTGRKNKERKKYSQDVTALRDTWYTLAREDQIEGIFSLTKRAVSLSLELIREFDAFIASSYNVSSSQPIVYEGKLNQSVFIDGWSKEKALEMMESLSRRAKAVVCCFPMKLSMPLLQYAKGSGPMSAYILRNLSADGVSFSSSLDKIFEERSMFFDTHMDYLLKNRLYYGYFFNYGYKPHAGLINKLIYMVYTVKHRARKINQQWL